MEKKTSPLEGMAPGKVFAFGIIQGFLVLCTIGFFILLGLTLSDGSSGGRVVDANAPTVEGPTDAGGSISIREVDEDNDHIKGNKNAPVTIVEYSDFDCPFCVRFVPTVEQALEKYPNDVRLVYRHFPLRSIHPNAAPAAEASECAAEQGKFWEYHDELFANQGNLVRGTLLSIANNIGLNISSFEECIDSGRHAATVQADEVDAQNAGARGTPYSIVVGPNGELIPVNGAQPFSQLDAALQRVLN